MDPKKSYTTNTHKNKELEVFEFSRKTKKKKKLEQVIPFDNMILQTTRSNKF